MADEFRAYFLRGLIEEFSLEMPRKVLVLGCGGGKENLNIKKIVNPSGVVTGIDIDLLSLTKNKDTTNLLQMDAARLAFKDDSFDCIFSYHVLEHVADYCNVLSEVRRILMT